MPAIGDMAPDFEMLSDEGKPIKLSDYRGKKVVLYFYPKDFTSGCEFQACSFRDLYPQVEAKNAVVPGVSADSVDSHKKFREELKLPFHLLVDDDHKVAGTWGTASARSHFIIDEQGKITEVQSPVKAAESAKMAVEKL